MRRRAFLAAFAAGTASMAGCSAVGVPGNPATRGTETAAITPAPRPTKSPTLEPSPMTETAPPPAWAECLDEQGSASIIDLETIPRTYALVPTRYRSDDGAGIRMAFAATETPEHPARLVASLHNANPFENTFRLDWTPPFGRLHSQQPHPPGEPHPRREHTYRDTLRFAPTENHELVEDPPRVERDDDGLWRMGNVPFEWPDTVRLDPGETVYGEYYVVGHLEGDGNGRPTGIYEFSRGQEGSIQIAVWDAEHPGPTGRSRFAGQSVPEPRESIAWYHDAGPETPSYVEPSTERAELPEAIDFTFVNHDREETSCGHWYLYKRFDGQWFDLGPYVRNLACRVMQPGGAKRWTLHAYHGEALPARGVHVYDHLGGGRYAAVAGYGHATSHSGAMVELVGDPVGIVPSDDVTVERSSGTVTVTEPQWDDGEHPPSATLTVTRADDAEESLIAEQVMRDWYRGLRNTLAFFDDDVDEVVLRTDEHLAERTVGYDSDVFEFRLVDRGQAFEARIDREAAS